MVFEAATSVSLPITTKLPSIQLLKKQYHAEDLVAVPSNVVDLEIPAYLKVTNNSRKFLYCLILDHPIAMGLYSYK